MPNFVISYVGVIVIDVVSFAPGFSFLGVSTDTES